MLTENICQGIASEEAEHGSAQLLTPQLGDIRRSFTFRWVVSWCADVWCSTVVLSSEAVVVWCKWSVSR